VRTRPAPSPHITESPQIKMQGFIVGTLAKGMEEEFARDMGAWVQEGKVGPAPRWRRGQAVARGRAGACAAGAPRRRGQAGARPAKRGSRRPPSAVQTSCHWGRPQGDRLAANGAPPIRRAAPRDSKPTLPPRGAPPASLGPHHAALATQTLVFTASRRPSPPPQPPHPRKRARPQVKVVEDVTEGLQNIGKAFVGVMGGANLGKMVVKVAARDPHPAKQ
jgi:hypothetical protein